MFNLEKTTTRKAFGATVLELARENPHIVVISGDCVDTMGLMPMEVEMPDRVINVGIAEQNAMASAAGLATTGYLPIVAGFGVFMSMRAVEQLRTFIAYPNLNVKIAGGQAGLSAAYEGVTHQATEDYGILRHFPNMVIAVPADAAAARVITRKIINHPGPAYIRLHKDPVYGVFDDQYQFEIGKANLLKDGSDATIICNGSMVYRSLEAWETLNKSGLSIRVLEMPCIKPIDDASIALAARETGGIITVEDHTIIGGLGGAVAEIVAEQCPVWMKRIGLADVFAESGNYYELLDKYGMSVDAIISATKEIVGKKVQCCR